MRIKKTIKRIGKCFIDLKQEEGRIIGESVLIVDNGYSWLGHLDSAIGKIVDYFPKADISVLTFAQRKSILEEEFPTLKFILPSEGLRPKRYQIGLQMLKIRQRKYDLILLFSLDITPLVATLFFLKPEKVILYSQWSQWWVLRFRNVTEIFKVTYFKKKTGVSLRNLLKRIGLFFILLQRKDEEVLSHSILVVDNGYASFAQLGGVIQRIKEALPQAKISLLALEQRKGQMENFSVLEIIKPDNCIVKKYRIARHMLRLRNNRYDYIILLSLDIIPIFISILFMNSKVLLYNQWHQWWSLELRNIFGYLKEILIFFLNIPVLIYLFITTSFILLRTRCRLGLINIKSIIAKKK